ncbi:MAG: acetate--CoA ligase family protein, partial [Gammaproteobacteria bacterium]|nr:acetate--CoA ligase family protein [Gammaproteobacteria bacterium]
GFPVVDGLRSFLAGVRCLFDYRDFRQLPAADPPAADEAVADRWRDRLASGATLEEYESARLLADFGLPMNPARLADSEEAAVLAAAELGFPVVLKTAEPGLLHKTDQRGVALNLADEAELRAAYRDLANRVGSRVAVSPMVTADGVEMVLGLVRDDQFGPLILLGFGGINVETLRDVACALPPFDRREARRLLDGLQLRSLLDGLRDRPAVDIDAFCLAAERFAVMADNLQQVLDEVDINPIIVHSGGCVAVDALVVGHAG